MYETEMAEMTFIKNKYNLMFTMLFAIVTASFIALIFNNNVWYDEAHSLAMVPHSFGDIGRITAGDNHPPMYYWGLKIFTAIFGRNLIAAKIFSIIPMCLTMLVGYISVSKLTDKLTGLMFSAFFVLLPVYTIYSVQLRMYSWAAFCVFTCGLFAYKACTENRLKDWIICTVCGVCGGYLHYFSLLSVGVIFGFLFAACIRKKMMKRWWIFAIIAVIAYTPWLTSFIATLKYKIENDYWIAPITPGTVLYYFTIWFKCDPVTPAYLVGTALAFVLAVIGVIRCRNSGVRLGVILGVGVFVMTVVLGIAASAAVRPVFIERYALPALPFIPLFIAVGIRSLDKKAICVAVSLFYIAGYAINYPQDFKFEYGEPDAETGEYINSKDFDAMICYVDSHIYGVIAYYAPDIPVYRPRVSPGSPFENIHPLSEFNENECKRVALFVPGGAEIPTEMAEMFPNITYDHDCYTYYGQKSNVYIMEK